MSLLKIKPFIIDDTTASDAFVQANAAFNQANTGAAFANSSFITANAAASFANGAFDRANSSYGVANTGSSFANGAFVQANNASSFANGAFVTANAAFTQANSNYTSAVTKLMVTAPGMYYSIDQYSGNNPTIYIRAGETIAFNLNVSGHPFMVRLSSGGSNYDTGLTHIATDGTVSTGSSAQGKITGILYWKVPYDIVGSTYVYQCSVHSGMVGNIVIDQPTVIAFNQANAAFSQANAAFTAANNSTDSWVRTQANNAFDTANASFIQANTPSSFANSSFAHANAAFNQANTGGTDAWVRTQANNAFDTANAAFNQANTGGTDAWVRTQANNAYNTANSAGSFANGSFVTANSGATFANAAFVHANAAFNAANTAGGGSSVDTYISLTMTGVITVPYTGTSRFYPPRAMTLSTVYANLSTAASGGNFTFIIKKNGTSIGNTFTITQNQTVMTAANISVSLATTDYLTLDVNGASATDLFVRIKYTNT